VFSIGKLKMPKRQEESFAIPFGVKIQGGFKSEVSGRIDGRIDGNIWVQGKLIIGEKAIINGNILVKDDLLSYGVINGNVEVAGKAVVYNNCYIKGNIAATTFEIDKNAVVDGQIIKLNLNGSKPKQIDQFQFIEDANEIEVEQEELAQDHQQQNQESKEKFFKKTVTVAAKKEATESWF